MEEGSVRFPWTLNVERWTLNVDCFWSRPHYGHPQFQRSPHSHVNQLQISSHRGPPHDHGATSQCSLCEYTKDERHPRSREGYEGDNYWNLSRNYWVHDEDSGNPTPKWDVNKHISLLTQPADTSWIWWRHHKHTITYDVILFIKFLLCICVIRELAW